MFEAWNDLCATIYERGKDTPARTWWHAERHPAIYRALRIDPADPVAFYATLPFRLARIDARPVLLIAHPCPLTLGPVDEDWLGIETVMAWNPVDGSVSVLGDDAPQIVGDASTGAIYGEAFAFARAWVEARAAFATLRRDALGKDWHVKPTESGQAPGALIVGDIDKIRWRMHDLPREIEAVGIDPARLNRAILRAANLPRARAANTMRIAA